MVSADSANAIDLNIRKDSHADITQWFYFRVQGAGGMPLTIRFLNAGKAAYPDGWKDYQATGQLCGIALPADLFMRREINGF